MTQTIAIAELMETSGVKFGTSGARGLVSDMTDFVCYTYTAGFLQYLETIGDLPRPDLRVAIAGDLRASTERIMAAVARAVADRGYLPVNCGRIPSPAVALYGIEQKIPSIMVTGSHIPDDRNGIKFNKASGEVLKDDEAGMKAQIVQAPAIFSANGMLATPFDLGPVDNAARTAYLERYVEGFPHGFLQGKSIGLYQHSAVGRDLLRELLERLGATVTPLGRSDISSPSIPKPSVMRISASPPSGQRNITSLRSSPRTAMATAHWWRTKTVNGCAAMWRASSPPITLPPIRWSLR